MLCGVRRFFVAMCAVGAASAATTVASHAQNSSISVTYTSLTSTPAAANFNALHFFIGYAEVTVNACGRTNCEVQMTNTATTPTGMRYVVVQAPFATPSSCGGTAVPASTVISSVLFVTTAAQAPRATRIYYCMPLGWTTSPPATFTTPQFRFTLTQRN